MQGHIRKKDNGWQYTVELGRDTSGKRKQKSKGGFKTKKECQAAMNELIASINKGDYYEEKNIPLSEYLNKWLDNIKFNIAESTFIFYKDIVDRVIVPSLGQMIINKIKGLQIQSFLTAKLENEKLSTTTVRHYYNVLNIALNQAVKWQIIQMNPCNFVEPPKASKAKIAVLNPEQVEMLLEYTKASEFSVMYLPFILALTCGLRRGEILGLQWEDVDLTLGVIRIKNNIVKVGTKAKLTTPKTDLSIRTVALLPSAIKILKEFRDNKKVIKLKTDENYDFVCTWPDGSLIRPDYLTHTVKKILKRCNLPDIRFHDLRHTHATLLLLKGVNPKVVSERLGHSKVDMTLDTYSHVLPEMQQEAVLKLEATLFKSAK